MNDAVVSLALARAAVDELRDGAVPRHVAGIRAGAAGAEVGELRRRVGAGGLGEADGGRAEQAAVPGEGARAAIRQAAGVSAVHHGAAVVAVL